MQLKVLIGVMCKRKYAVLPYCYKKVYQMDNSIQAQVVVELLVEPLKEVAQTLAAAPALTGHQSLAKKNRAAR